MRTLNKIIAILVIILNLIFYLPLTVQLIMSQGGPMGFGLLILPLSLLVNLFLIPAILIFRKKRLEYINISFVNWIGFIVAFPIFCILFEVPNCK